MTSASEDSFVGVDLGGTFIKSALVTGEGRILKKYSLATQAIDGVDAVLDKMREAIREVISEEAVGIGIGAPGLVDPGTGDVYDLTNFPGWRHVALASILKESFGLPVFVDNDGNVMALGECLWGAGRGANSLLGITLGTGVGGGLVLSQQPYQPKGVSAVEIGHIVVVHNGLACACGGRGCLERLVGNQFIVERFLQRVDQGRDTQVLDQVGGNRQEITPKLLSQAADEGDKLSQEIWQETGEYLGSALVTVINLLAPEVIAIGGGVAKAGEKLFDPIRRWVQSYAMSALSERVSIVPAVLGNDAGVIGAASLAKQRLL